VASAFGIRPSFGLRLSEFGLGRLAAGGAVQMRPAVPQVEFALENAHLVLFAAGRERTKAYSILVPTSGLTLLRRLFHPLWGDKNCRIGNSPKS
jgi:hypothetical protein